VPVVNAPHCVSAPLLHSLHVACHHTIEATRTATVASYTAASHEEHGCHMPRGAAAQVAPLNQARLMSRTSHHTTRADIATNRDMSPATPGSRP